MDGYERTIELERGVVNMDTGEFPMILASEGEASDGHILSIEGLEMPARMPMLFGHQSTVDVPSLGSIVSPEKSRDGNGLAIQRAVGQFNLTGDDPLAGVRRGIAQLVHDGDLPAVSIRWDGEGTPRSDLPEEHAHHVGRDVKGVKRFGLLFEKSQGREGSIVALGSDQKALSGRADAADDDLTRTFFRVLADTPERASMRSMSDAFAAMREAQSAFETAGMTGSDFVRMLGVDTDQELIRIAGHLIPLEAYQHLHGSANELMHEAFDLVASRAEVPVIAPEGADRRDAVDVGSPEGEVQPKVRTVLDMAPEELQDWIRRAATDAIAVVTGRRA